MVDMAKILTITNLLDALLIEWADDLKSLSSNEA